MDTWSIFASLASIASLLMYLTGNKNSQLRQLTFPLTTGLVGFAIGRNAGEFGPATVALIQDPYLLVIISIAFMLVGLTIYLVEALRLDIKISFIILVFLFTIGIPRLIASYNDIAPMIATTDYLTLAKLKENNGSTEEAIKYLRMYSHRVGKPDVKNQVNQKIDDLKHRQFRQDFIK
jgi:hypothetical protein